MQSLTSVFLQMFYTLNSLKFSYNSQQKEILINKNVFYTIVNQILDTF